jgi:hypothetical protein
MLSLERNNIFRKNPDQGKIILFHEDFTGIDKIPDNFFLSKSGSGSLLKKLYSYFFGEQQSDLRYDHTKCIVYTTQIMNPSSWQNNLFVHFTQFNSIRHIFEVFFLKSVIPNREPLFIGGLVPMTKCEYCIELTIPSAKGLVILETPHAKVIIVRKDFINYVADSFFTSTSEKIEYKRTIIPAREEKLSLKIIFDGIAKTNTIYGNDGDPIVTPLYSLSSSRLKYSLFSKGYIKITNIVLPFQGNSAVVIHDISQSAPRKLITPIGGKKLQPFGFDGPHMYETVKNGLLYMREFGYRGTIWFDKEYMNDEKYTTLFESLLIKEGWDAGIHFSRSLTQVPLPEVYKLISDEYKYVSSRLNSIPKSWCSHRNGDNVDFANCIFGKYTMIWRNGETGVHSEPGVGNLEDSSWEWWDQASKAGLVHPAFTHQTDKDPALPYSISYPKFKTWIDNYRANGISIIPFCEWWLINANTNDTLISNISIQNRTLKFTVITNGERALVNVNIAADRGLTIMDNDTGEIVNWTENGDASVSFYVQSNHEYALSKNKKDSDVPFLA